MTIFVSFIPVNPVKRKVKSMFATWDQMLKRQCLPCKKPLIGEPLQDLIYENGEWYHFSCLEKAKKQLAAAMKLARLAGAISEYVYYRDSP